MTNDEKWFNKKMDRREFLKKAGIGGAGLALGVSGASAFFVMLKGFSTPLPVWLLYLSFTLFYPFAMFVYESIVDLIIGDNIFLIPVLIMIIWKIIRFFIIWLFSIPIGLIGLIYLYFSVNRKTD